VNYGTFLAYVTVSVQSELILRQFQQHLFQRWTSFHSALWMSSSNGGIGLCFNIAGMLMFRIFLKSAV